MLFDNIFQHFTFFANGYLIYLFFVVLKIMLFNTVQSSVSFILGYSVVCLRLVIVPIKRVRTDRPGIPEITGYSSEQVLKTGDTARLVCVSRGGNPLAQVYWYRNDAELDFSYVSGGGRSENELIFTVQPSDNNAVYRCAASNQMTTEPLTTDIRLTVQCKYTVGHTVGLLKSRDQFSLIGYIFLSMTKYMHDVFQSYQLQCAV